MKPGSLGWWLVAAVGAAPLVTEVVSARFDHPDRLPVYGFPVGRTWWAGSSLEWFVSIPGLAIDLLAAAAALTPLFLAVGWLLPKRVAVDGRLVAGIFGILGSAALVLSELAPMALGLHHPKLELPSTEGAARRVTVMESQTYD